MGNWWMEVCAGACSCHRWANECIGNGISAVHYDPRGADIKWQRTESVKDHRLDHALHTFIDSCKLLFNERWLSTWQSERLDVLGGLDSGFDYACIFVSAARVYWYINKEKAELAASSWTKRKERRVACTWEWAAMKRGIDELREGLFFGSWLTILRRNKIYNGSIRMLNSSLKSFRCMSI